MSFKLPPLPYAADALEPYLSSRTIKTHYEKHHQGYVDKLNQLVKGTPYEQKSLREIILATRKSDKKIYNNAAQVWNHTFFWNCMAARPKKISNGLNGVLSRQFGSVGEFQAKFSESARELFGSGWTWLVQDRTGELKIRSLSNARNPMNDNDVPLLTCDVWEHAYYLDYKNERPKFLQNFWSVVNWEFVESELNHAVKSQAELVANLN